jgi:hypothetical protein
MGYRSSLISQFYSGELPEWFKIKYSVPLLFPNGVMICTKSEMKIESNELWEDYQMALKESGFWDYHIIDVQIVVLSEDGIISKVVIGKKQIKYYWADDLMEITHVWKL